MTRWFSVIQMRNESSEEGRFERVVDGVHKANKGWLYITLAFVGVAFVLWLAMGMLIYIFQ
jgi:hypothetical protein